MKLKFKAIQRPKAYANVPDSQWLSWTWQLQNRLSAISEFERVFTLSEEERSAFVHGGVEFKISTTPYYAGIAHAEVSACPIRRILMPTKLESSSGSQSMKDPLAEDIHSPIRCLIHRYSDRALFLVTDTCSVYCRYCTRKRFTGQDQGLVGTEEYQKALEYLKSHQGIREVIFSGGDPLTLSNAVLDRVLGDVRSIEHIEIIRIGSRMPVVCPMRVDDGLAQIFRKHKPVLVMSHFNHPRELTAEAAQAVEKLVDHGVPVFNQMVLLNGVNNHPAIVQALSRRLLYLRAKPYYMFQCDPSQGTDHLRTTVEQSLEIQRELWGHLSGLAMPTLALDIPDGGGKTYLVPNFETEKSPGRRVYKGWDGRVGEYLNPVVPVLKPLDVEDYLEEWQSLKDAKGPVL
jgi:lysine 2,3-aminomutase